jgi:hypothetical protein
MNSDIALALLNRAGTGADLLTILDSIAEDVENETVTDSDGTPLIW